MRAWAASPRASTPDGARFVVAQAWIPLAAEKELARTLVEVCRGFDIAR